MKIFTVTSLYHARNDREVTLVAWPRAFRTKAEAAHAVEEAAIEDHAEMDPEGGRPALNVHVTPDWTEWSFELGGVIQTYRVTQAEFE